MIKIKEVTYREWCQRRFNMAPREVRDHMRKDFGRSRAAYTVWLRHVKDMTDGITLGEFQEFNQQKIALANCRTLAEIMLRRDKLTGEYEIGVGARFS